VDCPAEEVKHDISEAEEEQKNLISAKRRPIAEKAKLKAKVEKVERINDKIINDINE